MTSPTNQTKEFLLRASRLGARLWRRNVGLGWIGDSKRFDRPTTVTALPGDVLIRKARPFHNGEPGQSDTYGWRTITITPDMVGQRIAQHVEIEVKQGTGRETKEQKAWGAATLAAGGIYGVARTIEDVDRLLG